MSPGKSSSKEFANNNEVIALNTAGRWVESLALNAALILGIPNILAKAGEGPDKALSVEKIVSHLPCKSPVDACDYLNRILSNLVSNGIFSETLEPSADGKLVTIYGLTPISNTLVKGDKSGLSEFMVFMRTMPMILPFFNLHDAVLSNVSPFESAHGVGFYDYFALHEENLQIFQSGMTGMSNLWLDSFLEKYEGLKDVKTVVDIGGGQGTIIAAIVAANPHLRGINFDRPEVVASSPALPGVEHVGGSYLSPEIPSGDVLILKWVLHNNDDETCLTILKNCCNTLKGGQGKLLICEYVLTPESSPLKKEWVRKVNLQMMCNFLKAKERTLDEYVALLTAAGFTRYELVSLSESVDVIEAWSD